MIGALIVKIVPHNETSSAYVAINTEDPGDETPFSTIQQRLSGESVVEAPRHYRSPGTLSSDLIEGESPRSQSSSFDLPIPETIESSDIGTPRNPQSSSKEMGPPDIYGRVLLMTPNFWLLFAIMSLRESRHITSSLISALKFFSRRNRSNVYVWLIGDG